MCWISGVTMLKAATASRLRITSRTVNEIGSGIRNCSGETIAIGTMKPPIMRSDSLGSRRYDRSKWRPSHGRMRMPDEAADRRDDAAFERVQPEFVLHVEAGEDGNGEEAEAERGETDHDRAQRADAHQSGERGLHRDRRRIGVLDHLAEHRLLLPLPPWWLAHSERQHARPRRPGGRAAGTAIAIRTAIASPPTSSGLIAWTRPADDRDRRRDPCRGARSDRCRRAASRARAACSPWRCRRRSGSRTA